jgi:hypothetical protein
MGHSPTIFLDDCYTLCIHLMFSSVSVPSGLVSSDLCRLRDEDNLFSVTHRTAFIFLPRLCRMIAKMKSPNQGGMAQTTEKSGWTWAS